MILYMSTDFQDVQFFQYNSERYSNYIYSEELVIFKEYKIHSMYTSSFIFLRWAEKF